jgi:hypothetical protein
MSKGNGSSHCTNCVHSKQFKCTQFSNEYTTFNDLQMLIQVHCARNVMFPACGELLRSAVNIVKHIEHGFCSVCKDVVNDGYELISKFTSQEENIKRYITKSFH